MANFNLFEFSATILEKGLLQENYTPVQNQRLDGKGFGDNVWLVLLAFLPLLHCASHSRLLFPLCALKNREAVNSLYYFSNIFLSLQKADDLLPPCQCYASPALTLPQQLRPIQDS